MPYDLRIWEKPIPSETYVIGGDPAEGLEHGDDSVLEVIVGSTGEQAAELQGKVDPFTFGELAYMLGMHYNEALIGIENNKDGGANRVLHEMGYKNIYFEQKDLGEPYDKHTIKLGINTNIRNRHRLISQARRWMEDRSAIPVSRQLVAQFETFVLRSTKFEAIPGGHDDLVMAWVIAIEMLRVHTMMNEAKNTELNPLWNAKEVPDEINSAFDIAPVHLIYKHVEQARKKEFDENPDYGSTVESMV